MRSPRAMLRGLLFGWLVGSTVGLVYAPRRGDQTRGEIRAKSLEMKDSLSRSYEVARQRSERLVRSSAERAAELIQQGQVLLDEQRVTLRSAINGVQAGVQAYTGNKPATTSREPSPETALHPAPASELSTPVQDPGLTDTGDFDPDNI